jgi:dienelactone hydrolase
MADVHGQFAGLQYKLRQPAASWGGRQVPLLLFLHGAGERGPADGKDIWKVHTHGPWKSPGAECCLLLAPQCPTGQLWPAFAEELVALIEHIAATFLVDRSRIYGTGLSLGAFGVWAVASLRPSLFAALVPICGGFSPPVPRDNKLTALLARAKWEIQKSEVDPLRHLPVWLFHGRKDSNVDVAGSLNVWMALGGTSRGDSLRKKIYEDSGHHIWGPAYRDKGLFEWLLEKRSYGEASAPSSSAAADGARPPPGRPGGGRPPAGGGGRRGSGSATKMPEATARLLHLDERPPSPSSSSGDEGGTGAGTGTGTGAARRQAVAVIPWLDALGRLGEPLDTSDDEFVPSTGRGRHESAKEELRKTLRGTASTMRAHIRSAHPAAQRAASLGAGAGRGVKRKSICKSYTFEYIWQLYPKCRNCQRNRL